MEFIKKIIILCLVCTNFAFTAKTEKAETKKTGFFDKVNSLSSLTKKHKILTGCAVSTALGSIWTLEIYRNYRKSIRRKVFVGTFSDYAQSILSGNQKVRKNNASYILGAAFLGSTLYTCATTHNSIKKKNAEEMTMLQQDGTMLDTKLREFEDDKDTKGANTKEQFLQTMAFAIKSHEKAPTASKLFKKLAKKKDEKQGKTARKEQSTQIITKAIGNMTSTIQVVRNVGTVSSEFAQDTEIENMKKTAKAAIPKNATKKDATTQATMAVAKSQAPNKKSKITKEIQNRIILEAVEETLEQQTEVAPELSEEEQNKQFIKKAKERLLTVAISRETDKKLVTTQAKLDALLSLMKAPCRPGINKKGKIVYISESPQTPSFGKMDTGDVMSNAIDMIGNLNLEGYLGPLAFELYAAPWDTSKIQ
ncbi:hypothetical protein KAU11_02435 [Candidatus Babeliales bacterium]|nr:hypothetical protein [Candidatus Babeliales bacterium]